MSRAWRDLAELTALLKTLLLAQGTGDVRKLSLGLIGDTLTMTGEVERETTRSAAKRLALSFAGIQKVRNDLEVAGYLAKATDEVDLGSFFGYTDARRSAAPRRKRPAARPARRGTGKQAREEAVGATEIVRRPTVAKSADPLPGTTIDLAIDLSTEVSRGDPRIVIANLPDDWDRLEVAVQVFAQWAAEIEPLEPTVTLLRDGSSRPARFRCAVRGDHVPGSPAHVLVSFAHGTRQCGSLDVDLAAEHQKTAPVPEPTPTFATPVSIRPEVAGPTLSVTIFRQGAGKQVWTWRALVPGGTQEGGQELDLGGEDAAFAEALLSECPGLVPTQHRRMMAYVGERLWQAAPSDFRSAFLGWRRVLPTGYPIQFVTDDPHVPWEMMKPNLQGFDHLFLEHPVARWPMRRAAERRPTLPDGALLSFVPGYGTGDALEGARLEGEWIVRDQGGRAMPPTRDALLEVLGGEVVGPIAMVHFAGHGSVHSGLMGGGLEMEDGTLRLGEVDQAETSLGQRDGTLVVLNACETGAGGRLLGMNTGWGAALAAQGFGGLIAPLWEVQDTAAFGMARSMLPPIVDGSGRLGGAVQEARRAHADASVAAFAYLVHGDVMASRARRR